MNEDSKITITLVEQLSRRGVNPIMQVRAGNQVADIVTDTAVYEVRSILTENVLRQAMVFILASRNALNPDLKMVIVGRRPEVEPTAALAEARMSGITVNFWTDSSSQLH